MDGFRKEDCILQIHGMQDMILCLHATIRTNLRRQEVCLQRSTEKDISFIARMHFSGNCPPAWKEHTGCLQIYYPCRAAAGLLRRASTRQDTKKVNAQSVLDIRDSLCSRDGSSRALPTSPTSAAIDIYCSVMKNQNVEINRSADSAEDPPPVFGSWRRLYFLVLLNLVVLVSLFFIFSRSFK